MNKLTGFVTIARKCGDEIGKAVAYTKDGNWFDEAVVTKTPIFDSNEDVGDVWFADEIYSDDEVKEATDSEIAFYKLKTGYCQGDGDAKSYKNFIQSHLIEVGFRFDDGEIVNTDQIVTARVAKKACKMAVKELAEKLLEMRDMNLAADMLGRIRDEKI